MGVDLMFKLVFENSKGESVELFSRPYRLMRVDGLGDVGVDVQTQKAPFQDGESLIDTVLEPRYLQIEVKIIGDNSADVEAKRRRLASVFNPKLQLGTLRYIRDDMIREIKAVAESIPVFPDGSTNRGRTFQKAVINLIAPEPYWRSPTIEELPAYEKLFEWPSDYWELGDDGNIYFEMGLQRTERIVVNDGDAPMPFIIYFYGPAERPFIENRTTGEFIQINKRLEENEILKVDTEEKSVVYIDPEGNETNVFNWLDLSSTFFYLQLGENEIACNCVVSSLGKDFDIFYQKRYASV